MSRTTKKDEEREHRISYEIIVDAYGPIEQALGGTTTSKRNCTSLS